MARTISTAEDIRSMVASGALAADKDRATELVLVMLLRIHDKLDAIYNATRRD